jgi:hypothetical protein
MVSSCFEVLDKDGAGLELITSFNGRPAAPVLSVVAAWERNGRI